jgi:hypothetical protein
MAPVCLWRVLLKLPAPRLLALGMRTDVRDSKYNFPYGHHGTSGLGFRESIMGGGVVTQHMGQKNMSQKYYSSRPILHVTD